MTLREYQTEAIESAYQYCRTRQGNPLVVLPTGAGKTRVMCKICSDTVSWGYRPLVISHSPELVQQTYREICEIGGKLRPSIFCAALNQKDLTGNVVVASVQSLYRSAAGIGMFRVALVDECDSIPNERTTGMYHSVIGDLRLNDPKLRLVGLTATPYRLDGGLIFGDDNLFDSICYEAEIHTLIKQGYLCPIVTRVAQGEVSRKGLKIRNGEFTEESMNATFGSQKVVQAAAQELMFAMQERNKCLVFCCSVKHCEMAARYLPDSAVLTHETPDNVRAAIIHGFKNGMIKYLININICAVGFNVPDVDCIALWRPTMSGRLYYQQVGRGMRIHPSKADCLVLDFAGNARTHGPINRIGERIKKKEKLEKLGIDLDSLEEEKEERVRVCPECRTCNDRENTHCIECGAQLKKHRDIKHSTQHDRESSIVDMEKRDDGYEKVEYVEFAVHQPRDIMKPKCLRITYHLSHGRIVSEYKHPEGQYSGSFRAWWSANVIDKQSPCPRTSVQAVEALNNGAVKFASHIRVAKNKKGYDEITGRRWISDEPQVLHLGIF